MLCDTETERQLLARVHGPEGSELAEPLPETEESLLFADPDLSLIAGDTGQVKARPVLVVLYDGVRLLDVSGPLEVFAEANEHGGRYELRTASPGGADVRANTGTRLGADLDLAAADPRGATVLVPGGPEWVRTIADTELVAQIRRLADGASRTASVCAGAFALAAAGVLDGRRATTHWDLTGQLARRFPLVHVDTDAIFVKDGPVITSAGVTSGIDLTLALVEEDLGPEIARLVAKHLVVFLQRPGGQSQFSVRLETGRPRNEVLRGLLDAVAANPSAPHTLGDMAAHAGVSVRHLTRLFHEELGRTPARFVEQIRLEFAQQQLEGTVDPLDVVARRSGFGSVETLRRAFARGLGVTPSDYRSRFRTTGIS